MQNEDISPLASGILQCLQEAIVDASGKPIDGIKKSVVYCIELQIIRQQLNMSQSQFAHAFGIPLRILQGWEQDKRKIDMTTASYLRPFPNFPMKFKPL